MDDKQTALLALLTQLQTQLRETPELDPAVASEVQAMVREIAAKLPASQQLSVVDLPLPDRLRKATLDFEASHPTLSQTVGNIADVLAQMGI